MGCCQEFGHFADGDTVKMAGHG